MVDLPRPAACARWKVTLTQFGVAKVWQPRWRPKLVERVYISGWHRFFGSPVHPRMACSCMERQRVPGTSCKRWEQRREAFVQGSTSQMIFSHAVLEARRLLGGRPSLLIRLEEPSHAITIIIYSFLMLFRQTASPGYSERSRSIETKRVMLMAPARRGRVENSWLGGTEPCVLDFLNRRQRDLYTSGTSSRPRSKRVHGTVALSPHQYILGTKQSVLLQAAYTAVSSIHWVFRREYIIIISNIQSQNHELVPLLYSRVRVRPQVDLSWSVLTDSGHRHPKPSM